MQKTFDDILREHPDFAKKMNELVVARQLETSISSTHGRTQGSMKVRQSDLNFANRSVEQKMKAGLDRRASRRKTIVKNSSQMGALFPESAGKGMDIFDDNNNLVSSNPNFLVKIDPSQVKGNNESHDMELISKAKKQVQERLEKEKEKEGAGGTGVGAGAGAGAGAGGGKSPSKHVNVNVGEEREGGGEGGKVRKTSITILSGHERDVPDDQQLTNIFDDLERRKSTGEIVAEGREEEEEDEEEDEEEKEEQEENDSPRETDGRGLSQIPGDYGGLGSWENTRTDFHLGKVHASILQGGIDKDDQKSLAAVAEEQKIHSRVSNTEQMLLALMKKLDMDPNLVVDGLSVEGGELGGGGIK